jgi:hypothetical protein
LLGQSYGTTGSHSFVSGKDGQKFLGSGQRGKTIFKRLNGTNVLFTLTGKRLLEVGDFTMDGNSLSGVLLDVRGIGQVFHDIEFKNASSTSYALNIQGSNRVTADRLYFLDGNYGHIYIGQDALMTYITGVQGGYAKHYSVYLNGSGISDAYFRDFSFDVNSTQTGFLGVGTAGGPVNVGFDNLHVETLQTTGTLIDIGDGGDQFNFKNINIVASSTSPSSSQLISLGTWFNVNIDGLFVLRPYASASPIIQAYDTKILSIKNVYDSAVTNGHVFFRASNGGASGPINVTLENIWKLASVTGVTNSLLNTNYRITNSNMNWEAAGATAYVIFENITGNINTANMTNILFSNCSGTITDAGNLAGTLSGWRTAVPAAANSNGLKGQYASSTAFFYVCIATNTWQRVAIATW